MSILPQVGLAVSGMLSIISTACLILIYTFKKSSRTYAFKLVLPLFIFDLIWSLNIVIPVFYNLADPDAIINMPLCRIQATIKLFTMLGSFFTTVTISWSLYSFIIHRKPIKSKNPHLYFSKYTVVLPLFFSIVPLALDRYNRLQPIENVMCFLSLSEEDGSTDYLGILLRVFLYYTPFVIVLIFDMFSVIRIYSFFHKNKIETSDKRDIRNLMLYPIVLFLSWIWIIIERVTEVIKNEDVEWLNNIDLSFATLNGCLNALVYGYISLDPFQHLRRKDKSDESSLDSSQLVSEERDTTKCHYNKNNENNHDGYEYKCNTKQSEDFSLTFHVNPQEESD
ncbi:slime mold cyclic AMP receptor (macronuclear) [Tetrahymena thermophila SB210]|uniref:Slime mold cyclic AMP receptor n=1 Tax=Tetrahymena thermophila (strain SB210) TaxID=312017 RepID=Q23WQ7_TETTS|nr:slime mold cyclic AMP receptor [Tetrahymena thermophila SB210]EAS00923.2 slime mold cyclic AMP receptor [Tetrahymena thermophila SB210]|eukprot:XP_001021168.2 slime mold cyclic AMP receptor [Tetrahymena thermophila SB210]